MNVKLGGSVTRKIDPSLCGVLCFDEFSITSSLLHNNYYQFMVGLMRVRYLKVVNDSFVMAIQSLLFIFEPVVLSSKFGVRRPMFNFLLTCI